MAPGEATHDSGREGTRRAKIWLEATTRVAVHWTNPAGRQHLSFTWADGGTFSFDMGGVLRGEDIDGQLFLAESKHYTEPRDQGTAYREFLAKCYRTLTEVPGFRYDAFMWISWAPFLVTEWARLRSVEFVKESLMSHGHRALSNPAGSEVGGTIDQEVCKKVADRIWVLLLSAEHEKLTLTRKHRGVVEDYIVRRPTND